MVLEELLFYVGRTSADSICESFWYSSVLNHISEGHLRISTPNSTYNFLVTRANSSHLLSAELKVVSDTFWIRLATMGDLGFAEAYMYGEVECEDLISTFQVCKLLGILQYIILVLTPIADFLEEPPETAESRLQVFFSVFPSPKDNIRSICQFPQQCSSQHLRPLWYF